MQLSYGCNRALPEGVRLAWGARLIAPADLVWDRQSWTDDKPPVGLSSGAETNRTALATWLNSGALRQAIDTSRELRLGVADPGSQDVQRLYEDERGIIVGSPQGSHGYVYLAGWLFSDVPEREGSSHRGVEVTETGRVLTDADMERLADEAQQGAA